MEYRKQVSQLYEKCGRCGYPISEGEEANFIENDIYCDNCIQSLESIIRENEQEY